MIAGSAPSEAETSNCGAADRRWRSATKDDAKKSRRALPFWVMAKPTGPRCNLDCSYCYYLDKVELYPDEGKFRMSPDILEIFIRDYIASQSGAGSREIHFVWQGGEPTMLGLGYFRDIVALQRRHCPAGHAIRNALQTNSTLLDEEWARFLHDEGFLVGLSQDGPPHLHDHYRRDRRDQPSSPRVLSAWDLLTRHRVETNVLCVVSNHNAGFPLEVYRYLRDTGVQYMQFIPVVELEAELAYHWPGASGASVLCANLGYYIANAGGAGTQVSG